jgi:hypothetical protein
MCYFKKQYVKNRFILNVITTIIIYGVLFTSAITEAFGETPSVNFIIGEWVRSDGDYILDVQDIRPDNSVVARYLNPANINVSEALISEWNGLLKLFIKLKDKGYPGSTYTLYYYEQKDALVGFYYQAAIGKTFEVVFLRNPMN